MLLFPVDSLKITLKLPLVSASFSEKIFDIVHYKSSEKGWIPLDWGNYQDDTPLQTVVRRRVNSLGRVRCISLHEHYHCCLVVVKSWVLESWPPRGLMYTAGLVMLVTPSIYKNNWSLLDFTFRIPTCSDP